MYLGNGRPLFEGEATAKRVPARIYGSLYRTRARIFCANVGSGLLIAVSVFYFGHTLLAQRLADLFLRMMLIARVELLEERLQAIPLLPTCAVYLLVILIAAGSCTFVRSLGLMAAINLSMVAFLLASWLRSFFPFPMPVGVSIVVVLITAAALLDNYLDDKRLQRRIRQTVEKQRGEFAIIRHINHNVNPTIQTALSPLSAVIDLVERDPSLDRVIGRRRDGSEERVRDALEAAQLGLRQIREILVTTEDIFSNRLGEEDFTQVDIRDLFRREIVPLYSDGHFEIRTDFGDLQGIMIHRPSFIQAIRNLLRNAEVHAFPEPKTGTAAYVQFTFRETVREVVIDYENNGLPFPRNFSDLDFLAFGRKGKNSTGKGLGGAWVEKFLELHNGRFAIICSDPVRFRITLPKRRKR